MPRLTLVLKYPSPLKMQCGPQMKTELNEQANFIGVKRKLGLIFTRTDP